MGVGMIGGRRASEFAALALAPAMPEALLAQQSTAQERGYRSQWPDAEFTII